MTTFLLLALAALYAGLAYPLVQRRVPPNQTYGIRTAATRADDGVWYDANAAGGRDMAVLAVVFAVCGLALPNTEWGVAAGMTLVVIGTLVMAWVGMRRADRMLAALDETDDDGIAEAAAPEKARRRQRARG